MVRKPTPLSIASRAASRLRAREIRPTAQGSRSGHDPWQDSTRWWQGWRDTSKGWGDSPPAAPCTSSRADIRRADISVAHNTGPAADGGHRPVSLLEDALKVHGIENEGCGNQRCFNVFILGLSACLIFPVVGRASCA